MSQHHLPPMQPYQGFHQPLQPFEAVTFGGVPAHGPLLPPATPFRPATSPAPWLQGRPSTPIIPYATPQSQPAASSPTDAGQKKKKKTKNKDDDCKFTELDRQILGEMLLADKDTTTADTGHKASVWQKVADKLNTQLTEGKSKDVRACQSQRNYIASDYWKPINDLLKLSGFGWDDSRNIVTAEKDVWDEYIKKHPEAKKWQTKSWKLYPLWNSYFEGTKAHGKNVVRPGRVFEGLGGSTEESESYGSDTDANGEAENVLVPDSQPLGRSAGGPNLKRKSATKASEPTNAEGLLAIAKGFESFTKLAREQLDRQKQSNGKGAASDRLKEAIREVRLLEYLDLGEKVKVINQLTAVPTKAITLMSVLDDEGLVEGLMRSWLDEQ